MSIRKVVALVCVACSLLGVSSAAADTIKCSMKQPFNPYYIAPNIEFEIGDFGGVVVRDALIASTGRESAYGEVAKDSATLLSIRWDVVGVKPDPNEFRLTTEPHLVVRLTIQKSDGSATMTVVDAQRRGTQVKAKGKCSAGN